MTTARGFAPAKVNLTLHVTGQREDGYHLLDSLVVFAQVGDWVSARAAPGLSLLTSGPFGDRVPSDGSNLVTKAADLLATGGAGASLTLEKHLPPASGIGGGSSDAAATLRVLSDLWDVPMPGLEQALALGADVPVCLDPTPTRMRGIGEQLDPVPPLPRLDMVLVNPGVSVSTPAVFQALAGAFGPAMTAVPEFANCFALADWLGQQRNDLQAPAVRLEPEIGDVLQALEGCDDCLIARMSGSGATCFGLFPDATARERAARIIASENPDWWVAEG